MPDHPDSASSSDNPHSSGDSDKEQTNHEGNRRDGGDARKDRDESKDEDKPRDGKSGDDQSKDGDQDKKDGDKKEKDEKDGDKKAGDKDQENKRPGKKPLIILGVVVVLLAIVAFVWWFAHRNEMSTDDAYTDGNAVMIAPKVSGYVVELRVNDNTRVRKGDLLLRIDARDYHVAHDQAVSQLGLAQAQLHQAEAQLALAKVQYPAQLAQARAQRESAQAELANAQAAYDRQHAVDQRATSQQNVDAATAQQRSAQANVASAQAQVDTARQVPQQVRQIQAMVEAREAQVQQAQAQLEQADLNLSYTEVRAPSDGWVTRRNVQVGNLLQAGTMVFALVTPEVWVTANFKETQLKRMRVGDAVEVDVDAYPDLELHGHVDSIQLGSGSRFSAFPAENATGNFVKIVQRVPVKIVIDRGADPNRPLPLGLSVTPTVQLK